MSILYHGSHHGQNVQAVTLYKISYLTEIQKKRNMGSEQHEGEYTTGTRKCYNSRIFKPSLNRHWNAKQTLCCVFTA